MSRSCRLDMSLARLLLALSCLLASLFANPLYRFTPRDHFRPDINLKDVTWDSLDEKKYFYRCLAGINSSEIARHDAMPRGPSMPQYLTPRATRRPWQPTRRPDRIDWP